MTTSVKRLINPLKAGQIESNVTWDGQSVFVSIPSGNGGGGGHDQLTVNLVGERGGRYRGRERARGSGWYVL